MSLPAKLFNPIHKKAFNLLLATDVYKIGHMLQYPKTCEKVYSYMMARSDKTFDHTVSFGMQYIMKEYLTRPITRENVKEFMAVAKSILGHVPDDIETKLNKLADLGYLPVEIKAVPEGSIIPNRNVLLTITNTKSEFYWTVGFIESLILKLWYPITVATASYQYRKLVEKYFNETADESIHFLKPFMVHDFGYRGDSSEESASISGASHLLSFTGSDTIPALPFVRDYYNVDISKGGIMASVPASEHSVMCAFGRDGEIDAFKNMLKLYPTGIVSIVSDTYNIWDVMTNFTSVLKDDILSRDGKVVFRPDSGNPKHIICGNPDADATSPEGKGCLRLLDEAFGSTINSKGYKVLNPKVGLIYGDGMFLSRYTDILETIKSMGYSTENLVIGVGGILRYHSRDTLSFAIKATKVIVDGEEQSIMKDPITDKGKKSHTGCVKLEFNEGKYSTKDGLSFDEAEGGVLRTVFKDGALLVDEDLDTIRKRVRDTFVLS